MTVDVGLDRQGIKIPGCEIPMLSLTPVRRQFDRSAIGAEEGLINVQHRLYVVVARRHVFQRPDRIAVRLVGDGDRLSGTHTVHRNVPKTICERGPSLICIRGSAPGSVESKSRIRPSCG